MFLRTKPGKHNDSAELSFLTDKPSESSSKSNVSPLTRSPLPISSKPRTVAKTQIERSYNQIACFIQTETGQDLCTWMWSLSGNATESFPGDSIVFGGILNLIFSSSLVGVILGLVLIHIHGVLGGSILATGKDSSFLFSGLSP
jgi:hypothetical protein